MRRNIVETIIGAVGLVVAIGFFTFAYSRANVGTVDGYELTVDFTNVGTLAPGADVRISGIKVGSVLHQELNPETFLARVVMSIDDRIELPTDTSASIGLDGLLGGAYLQLEPGGEEAMLEAGDNILYAEAALDLIALVKQMVFSQKNN